MQKRGNNRNWSRISYALLIAFAVISFWRGLWGLWDIYIFPNNYQLSLWISLAVGIIILYLTRNIVKQII